MHALSRTNYSAPYTNESSSSNWLRWLILTARADAWRAHLGCSLGIMFHCGSSYIYICERMYVYIYTCMHTDDAHIHAYVHVYIYINLFTPVSTCICVNGTIYTQVHIHINTTMYIYIYTHTSLEMLQLCRFRPWMLTLFRSCTQSSHRLPARRPDVLQLLRIGFRV